MLICMTTRFALLRHEVPESFGRSSHWDLLLERENSCWTWALEVLPHGLFHSPENESVSALRLPDHRKHYLDYQGPLSGDRGTVHRTLGGTCKWLENSDKLIVVELAFEQAICTLTFEKDYNEHWKLSLTQRIAKV